MNILKGVLLAILVVNASGQPKITIYTNGNLRIVTIIEPITDVLIGNPKVNSNTITTHPSPPSPAGTPVVWLPNLGTTATVTNKSLVTNQDGTIMVKRVVEVVCHGATTVRPHVVSRSYQKIVMAPQLRFIPASINSFIKEDGAFVEIIGPTDGWISVAVALHPAKSTCIEYSRDLITWIPRRVFPPGDGYMGLGAPIDDQPQFFRAFYGHLL